MVLQTAPNHLIKYYLPSLIKNILRKDFSHFINKKEFLLWTANCRNITLVVISGLLVQSYKAISSSMQDKEGYFYQALGKGILNFLSQLLMLLPPNQCPALTSFPKLPLGVSPWCCSVLHFFSTSNISNIYNSARL